MAEREPEQAFMVAALVQALALEDLIPGEFAHFRPLVSEAATFFLTGLPPERLRAIADEQLALPLETREEVRIALVLGHCPTLHKLGQVLARDPRLPVSIRRQLQRLESLPGSWSGERLHQLVVSELGRKAPVKAAPRALAEGSVAVVVPFTSRAGDGVLKLLKPGVETLLEQDLALWEELAGFMEQRQQALQLPELPFRETLESVARLLRNEIRLDREQAHMQWARAQYAGKHGIRVPALLPWCTPRLTAMEWLPGDKVTAVDGWPDTARRRLAGRVVDAVLSVPMWRPDERVLVHGDPHAGNLLLSPDNDIGLIDWSLACELSKPQRVGFVGIIIGGLLLDGERVEAALRMLGGRIGSPAALQPIIREALGRVVSGRFPGLGWVTRLLDRTAAGGGVIYPESLILLRKTLLTLDGVAADIAPSTSTGMDSPMEQSLISAGLLRLWQEWPLRGVAGWGQTAGLGSHVSNADLAALWWHAPTLPLRYWQAAVSPDLT